MLQYSSVVIVIIIIVLVVQGDALLHVLCSQGRVDAAAVLLKRGAPVNALNAVGDELLCRSVNPSLMPYNMLCDM